MLGFLTPLEFDAFLYLIQYKNPVPKGLNCIATAGSPESAERTGSLWLLWLRPLGFRSRAFANLADMGAIGEMSRDARVEIIHRNTEGSGVLWRLVEQNNKWI